MDGTCGENQGKRERGRSNHEVSSGGNRNGRRYR
jgi:hypothetical protein